MTSPKISTLDWYFPLNRPHTGVPLGNGTQGLLIWGENSLRLTIARAGFWDHRNGQNIPPTTTFAAVRRALEAGDEEELSKLFPKRKSGDPFPQQMGGGRLELTFPVGLRPIKATLDLTTAEVVVSIGNNTENHTLRIRQDSQAEVCWIDLPQDLIDHTNIRLFSAYELVHQDAMRQIGIAPPETWLESESGGFCQKLPDDDPLAVAWGRCGNFLLFATSVGEKARENVGHTLVTFNSKQATEINNKWWHNYWSDVPFVTLPDATLQELYDYGLYRQAGLIRRHTPAATLQGPWMEDTRIAPWSNDYHFNINVQLVYGAALATGRYEDTRPLWELLKGWLPQLREMGFNFYGIEGAMILPHAVDDRCQLMGTFWAGTIDQACIAWIGQMAFQYFQHTFDNDHLRDLVFPLLQGAFLGYLAMLETVLAPDGSYLYSLPISVSPEFGGTDIETCWGRDASFQLAALHSTLQLLPQVAKILNLSIDPRWRDIADHLPEYTTTSARNGGYGWISEDPQRIALWKSKDLPESHRHHSHLASIHPFQTIDPFDPKHQKTVAFSLNRWNTLGAGNWTGWSVAWASTLCSRCGLPDAAFSWLQLLSQHFTNEGRATLHNANAAGVFAWDDGSLAWPDHLKGSDFLYHEVMQMDAAMGAISGILEMLIQMRGDVIYLTDRLPKGWRDLSFARIRMAGGFLVSANFQDGQLASVKVQSVAGSPLHLWHGNSEAWTLDGISCEGLFLKLPTTEIDHAYTLKFGEELKYADV